MKLSVAFAKFESYGTLVGAIAGMVILPALAIVVAVGELENGGTIVITFSGALGLGVIAFGSFSPWRPPSIGIEWEQLKASIGNPNQ